MATKAASLEALSPADARIMDDLIAGARAMQGIDMSGVSLSRPPEMMGPLDQVKDLWAMRRVLKYFSGKYAKPVADYVRGIQDPSIWPARGSCPVAACRPV